MRKYFLQDKNHILIGAQYDLRENLLSYIIDTSKDYYQQIYNPLGLLDDTILKIQEHEEGELKVYEDFYELLGAIYRFKYGSAQLEFLFDGMDHYSKYATEWESKFKTWMIELFRYEPFLKTVLQLSVFGLEGHSKTLATLRLRNYLFQHFDLKIYKYKGLVENVA